MQSAKQIISKAGLRATKAREIVLTTILEAESALSQPEVFTKLAEHNIDRVTVYRVLDWLTEHHLVHKISGDNRAWKFQASHADHADDHSHSHLHCNACGKVMCIHELSAKFPQALLSKYQITQVQVNLKGICPDCTSSS